jgi:hypothetical protein
MDNKGLTAKKTAGEYGEGSKGRDGEAYKNK